MLMTIIKLITIGSVELNCGTPGSWSFDMTSERQDDKVEIVHVSMKSEEEATPPQFSVRWFMPQTGIHHVWTSESTHYGIPWSEAMVSELTSFMPVYTFMNASEGNQFTCACSESCRRVVFKSPINEVKMGFDCSFTFFTVAEAPIKEYRVDIRLDSRKVFYADAIGDASDWIGRSAKIEALKSPESAFEPLYSTWYDFHQDISAEGVEDECLHAAELGMKTVIVDDGWQIDLPLGNRPWNGYRLCGDWKPGRHFPDMATHVKRVHDMGLKYMMWYSVPFVGKDSGNFARFNGKYLPVECAGGHVLDPRFPEVREFIVKTYEDAVREWNIDGLKLDFIGRFALKDDVIDPAVAENYAGRDIKSIPLAVEALLSTIMERLQALKPEILIEFRQPYIGPSIRRFGNMIRASDCPLSMVENRTRIARLRLTSGKTAVHADMLEWRKDESTEDAARFVLNSIFGVIQYSVRLNTLSDAHRAMMKHWIRFASQHKEALVKGSFRPHHPAADYPLLEGESAAERIFGVYQDGLVVDAGAADRPVYVLNAANTSLLTLAFCRAPDRVEVYDTFGSLIKVHACGAGIQRLNVPVAGYVKICN